MAFEKENRSFQGNFKCVHRLADCVADVHRIAGKGDYSAMKKKRKLTKKQIDAIFENASDQGEAAEKLYRLVLPEMFDPAVKKVIGFPECGQGLSEYLFGKFIDFDQKYHPDIMAGGLWLNKGFSTIPFEKLGEWEVSTKNCQFIYHEKEEAA